MDALRVDGRGGPAQRGDRLHHRRRRRILDHPGAVLGVTTQPGAFETNRRRRAYSHEPDGDSAMVARVEAYRVRAAECDAAAANSTDAKTQTKFNELAAQWRILAELTEASGGAQPAGR
jgi:hypothetical protein